MHENLHLRPPLIPPPIDPFMLIRFWLFCPAALLPFVMGSSNSMHGERARLFKPANVFGSLSNHGLLSKLVKKGEIWNCQKIIRVPLAWTQRAIDLIPPSDSNVHPKLLMAGYQRHIWSCNTTKLNVYIYKAYLGMKPTHNDFTCLLSVWVFSQSDHPSVHPPDDSQSQLDSSVSSVCSFLSQQEDHFLLFQWTMDNNRTGMIKVLLSINYCNP